MKGLHVWSTSDVQDQKLLMKKEYRDHSGLLGQIRGSFCSKKTNLSLAQVRSTNGNTNAFPDTKPVKLSQSSSSTTALVTPQTAQTSQRTPTKKRVFTIGKGRSDGNKSMKSLCFSSQQGVQCGYYCPFTTTRSLFLSIFSWLLQWLWCSNNKKQHFGKHHGYN